MKIKNTILLEPIKRIKMKNPKINSQEYRLILKKIHNKLIPYNNPILNLHLNHEFLFLKYQKTLNNLNLNPHHNNQNLNPHHNKQNLYNLLNNLNNMIQMILILHNKLLMVILLHNPHIKKIYKMSNKDFRILLLLIETPKIKNNQLNKIKIECDNHLMENLFLLTKTLNYKTLKILPRINLLNKKLAVLNH